MAPEQQYACGSGANRTNSARANEIVCFPLDGSLRVLVVAPVMTDLNAPGGGDDYAKLPKGNLDVTGEYFIWTSNLGGNRLDAFIVRVPGHLLTGVCTAAAGHRRRRPSPSRRRRQVRRLGPDHHARSSASDNVGVVGVQFRSTGRISAPR